MAGRFFVGEEELFATFLTVDELVFVVLDLVVLDFAICSAVFAAKVEQKAG